MGVILLANKRQLHKETHCVFVSRRKTQCEFGTHSFHFIPPAVFYCPELPLVVVKRVLAF
ncbi:unnamed protein product [Brassica napus]|uniref:(rape) hypothetical protein n=1 Tax=Brassica napus TaxID=3708 RepID=A0A816HXY6_BRANA|nr:unnamed protein product [Brassica napus]